MSRKELSVVVAPDDFPVISLVTSVTGGKKLTFTEELFPSIPDVIEGKTWERRLETVETFAGPGAFYFIGALGGLSLLTEGIGEKNYGKAMAGFVTCVTGLFFAGKIGIKHLEKINIIETQLKNLQAFVNESNILK